MALVDRVIDFPISGGLNEGADELQSNAPFLDDATDCLFLKDGRVERRKGTLAPSATAGALANAIFARKDRAFTYSESGFIARPSIDAAFGVPLNNTAPRPCDVSVDALVRSSADVFDSDLATVNGFLCTVWSNLPANAAGSYSSTSNIYARVLDEATGAVVLDVTLATDATNPRVVQLGNRFFVTAVSSGAMGFWTWDTTTPTGAWSASGVLHTGAVTGYDLCVAANPGTPLTAFVALYDISGVTLKLIDGTTLGILSNGPNALTDVQAIGVCHSPGNNRVWVATFRHVSVNQILLSYSNASTLSGFTAAGSREPAEYPADFGANNMADWRIAIEQRTFDYSGTSNRLIVAWSWGVGRTSDGVADGYAAGAGSTFRSKCAESCLVSDVGFFSPSTATSPGYELVSKPFLLANTSSDGVCTMVLKWGTPGANTVPPISVENNWVSFQSAGTLVQRVGTNALNSYHVPIARVFNRGVATLGYSPYPINLTKNGFKPRRVTSLVRSSVNSNQILTSTEVYTRAPVANTSGLDPVDNGIDIARIGLRSACKPLRCVDAAGSVHTHGGFHTSCDGVRGLENSIHYFPEKCSVEIGAGGGTNIFPTATTNYNVVIGWVFWDADGQEHRSGISAPNNTSTSPSDVPARMNVSPPPMTGSERLMLRVWMTGDIGAGASGDVYTLVLETDTFVYLSGNAGWISVSLPKPTTIANELVYTAGGVLPSEAAPAFRDIAAWQDVLVGINAEDRNELWYTKPIEPGYAPEWNPALTIRLPSDGGDVVAIVTVDDKLVCLKERAVYYVVGSLRNGLGQGNDPTVVRVASDVGCVGRHTTALIPDGLLFVANNGRGLVLLDRGMSIRRMRQAENRFAEAGDTIHSALVVPHESCVRWATTSGVDNGSSVIVLDYEHGVMSRFTEYSGGVHHAVIDGRVWLLDTNGAVKREAIVGEVVATQAPYWSVTTAWIKLGGLNGFQRQKRLLLLSTPGNRSVGAVGLGVNMYLNYDDSLPIATATWDPLQWGPGFFGHQVEWHIPKQKCTSVKFTIYEREIAEEALTPDSDYSSCTLSQLSLRLGVKPTHSKNLSATTRSPGGGGGV